MIGKINAGMDRWALLVRNPKRFLSICKLKFVSSIRQSKCKKELCDNIHESTRDIYQTGYPLLPINIVSIYYIFKNSKGSENDT